MKLSCSIADDLLPLYLEDVCSRDSKDALEEHLRECPACREKLARMRNNDVIPQIKKPESEFPIAGYAKKVKRRRIRVGLFAALTCALAACVLALCVLTIADMRAQANPTVFEVEEGVWNLTAEELETTAGEVGEYILYTNSQQIQVSVAKDADFDGEVLLWNAENKDSPILYGHVDPGTDTCVFANLTSRVRYIVTCGGDADMTVTISEGRVVSFFSSLMNVLGL